MLSDQHDTIDTLARLGRKFGVRELSDRLYVSPRVSSHQVVEWWRQLPELASSRVRLRELRLTDAPSLTEALGSAKVGQHLSCNLASMAETEEFIGWTRRARMAGRYICFGVVPEGRDAAIGVFQLWPLEPSFQTAEWGFAIGHQFWGSGLFMAGARLVMTFVFETLGVHRLEARAAVDNDRGNSGLKKLGAVPEGVLRQCFLTDGAYRDHVMWSILASDWRAAHKDVAGPATGAVA